ncbi:type II secretion system protein [Candidatus Saccharibacteria bacterium]|nr:type II secretion system protein [Candidatus Saccharibacteria bacterium]
MTNKLKRGFTLIEIVIVLAIAALILVVVFIAVQGAQRSQRNDSRRALASRVSSAINDFKANTGGGFTQANAVTFAAEVAADKYLSANDKRVGNDTFTVQVPALAVFTVVPPTGSCNITTAYAVGLTGGADQAIEVRAAGNPTQVYVSICLESGSTTAAQSGTIYTINQ